ncbi:nucleoside phosphorylase [Roseivirga pacifica]|uniref:nucleoside phosphorylase n=1 Tax=Roseivirga pacifica TaxID=1267423 RepID=UPI0020952033|nr:nucleoside phosphorylase [Roseivirga pacifica]MCO6358130.1 phosphorylase [Roseivirga pacifica]MCO6366568.1 phosphorylase [Roseivirga pacifica]MCO6371053.1 phosphorylase [Roseivirga pacifica]MCO6373861.1 phosphorylase [Roseivirga pacifica]MCO6380842.1 phosphorylase [Roseivirga pacifica]
MSKRIPDSELIISPQGRVYHLNLHPEMVAEDIIVVGDPERVPKISAYFDKIEHQVNSRELVTHTGTIGRKRLSVISSGMGTDNVELLMTELDALVNIDFATRTPKRKQQSLRIYRIGTSGCIQPDIPIDAFLVSTAALGLDTLMAFYKWEQSEQAESASLKVQRLLGLPFKPYLAEGSKELLAKFSEEFYQGVTVTAPGFYAPQGRALRKPIAFPTLPDDIAKIETGYGRFTNFEMETAGYYAMAKILGHQMISLNALIANRPNGSFSANHEATVDRLIRKVITTIV